jgi:hypothetical protein
MEETHLQDIDVNDWPLCIKIDLKIGHEDMNWMTGTSSELLCTSQ